MENRPTWLLMENVHGFELSPSRDAFVEALGAAGFRHQEYLLSPDQFGSARFLFLPFGAGLQLPGDL